MSRTLDPKGRGAEEIAGLWWLMFWLAVVVVAIVVVLVAIALLRRRRAASGPGPSDRVFILGGGVALSIAVLVPVIALTIGASRGQTASGEPDLEIVVTGHQFWWDLRYPAPGAQRVEEPGSFRSANEIHVPTDRDVRLRLRSADVVHSFWVPEIDGKRDLVPGRENTLDIRVDEPGVYRGQCAELCGDGHALMKIVLVAQPPEQFARWQERESGGVVAQPSDAVREELANSCAPCHDMRGILEEATFSGEMGPDLTHLAGRRMIGANLLPNTPEALGRWIVDPQGVKPGNRMPDVLLEGEDLADVVAYLRELE